MLCSLKPAMVLGILLGLVNLSVLGNFEITSENSAGQTQPNLERVSNRDVRDKIDFNRDIRPILSDNCFHCHGQDPATRQSDLRLDRREDAIAHGALVSGDASSSTMITRILAEDDSVMPPISSNRQLSVEQKRLLEQWVEQGAQYEVHWAFQKPQKVEQPTVENGNWITNPIDRFVLARLEKEGLHPSPQADRPTLIKRLYSDLIGYPPTPEAIESYVNDSSPDAYEKLVDSLMEKPQYGERLALPWLDAARYADSNGFQQDGDTWQWVWRDWVVNALNQNLPYDKFVIWQLAGDLLPDATTEQKIASGFNRNHMLNGEGGAIAEEQRFNILFDRMDATSTVFLGLTMACAQCHDHKYDPITQADYYKMLDAFNRVPETGTPQFFSSRIRVAAPFLEVPTEENKRRLGEFDSELARLRDEMKPIVDAAFAGWRSAVLASSIPIDGLPSSLSNLLIRNRINANAAVQPSPDSKAIKVSDSSEKDGKPEDQRDVDKPLTDEEKKTLEIELRKHFDTKVQPSIKASLPILGKLESLTKSRNDYERDQVPRPMIMSDSQARVTKILSRGDYLSPLDPVEFSTPAFLPPQKSDQPANRLGLALWLVHDEHPLTARVQVNRMWQHFFHQGLHKTPEDFGVQSEYPIHKELLDWLAVEFRENGWDMKKLNRLILTSSTYKQASKVTPELLRRDPANQLYARASRFRMPSMVLRDWALGAAGQLNVKVGGKPVYPYQPEAVWESLAITKERDFTYPQSTGEDLYRRSLYTFWRRTLGPANMFDSSNRQTCSVKPFSTSTPLHALTTLNDPTWVEAARGLALQVTQQSPELRERIRAAGVRVLCRELRDDEVEKLEKAYMKQLEIFND